MKKFLFLTASIAFLIFPLGTSAQADQRCFPREDCVAARAALPGFAASGASAEEGFYPAAVHTTARDACGGAIRGYNEDGAQDDLGLCLPVGQSETTIAIGGRKQFGNVADFIAYIYRYSMIVAMTLAVLMLIVAGFQYMTSAGDSTKMTSAKKRISGAIIGLVLLATSFTILNTINPALVELRLPQIWLVRGLELAPLWCENVAGVPPPPIALAQARNQETPTPFSPELFIGTSAIADPATAECGNSYYIANAGGQMCYGLKCNPMGGRAATCALKTGTEKPDCYPGNIVGNIFSSSFEETQFGFWARTVGGILVPGADDGWAWKWIDDDITDDFALYSVCQNGEHRDDISSELNGTVDLYVDDPAKILFYQTRGNIQQDPDIKNEEDWCNGENRGGLAGFVLGLDVNEFGTTGEEEHYIGRQGNIGIDLGNRQVIALGVVFDLSEETRNCFLRHNSSYFFSPAELLRGVNINVDVSGIADIDSSPDDVEASYPVYETCAQEEEQRQQAELEERQRGLITEQEQAVAFAAESCTSYVQTVYDGASFSRSEGLHCQSLYGLCENGDWGGYTQIEPGIQQLACTNMNTICTDVNSRLSGLLTTDELREELEDVYSEWCED